MKYKIQYIALLLLIASSYSYGQLSPGKLSEAHAEFEGLRNCTECHDLGKEVSSTKCLDCHTEVKSLVEQNTGYHASDEVQSKECFDCHSEHHGRKFNMIRFDTIQFDHELTGYELEGQHDIIDCRDCHIKDNIVINEFLDKQGTFMGLDQECLSCHDDFHQETLPNDCVQCHDIEAFRPAPFFNHDSTEYILTGEHIEVECVKCHQISTRSGVEFQEFSDIPFNDCISCHEDPHEENIAGECKKCHTESAFENFIGDRYFNHKTTEFELLGKHSTVACFSCHNRVEDPLLIFQDKIGISENQCVSCHEDVHEGRFGNDCAQCHHEDGFTALKSMDSFDHNLTDYPLEGKHIAVDCKACHAESYAQEIDFSACSKCHEDYHKGQFVVDGTAPDCVECHSVNYGFDHSLYTIGQHQKSVFPLEGAHIATPCFACHVSEEEWSFRNIGSTCTDCHQDEHHGQFEENGITDCESCHNSDDWFPSLFDHNSTEFALDGKHAQVDCIECHKPITANNEIFIDYKTGKTACIDCHN